MISQQPDPSQHRILKIFVDGASRGNPGASGIGIFCYNAQGSAVIETGFFTGDQTCNQAEYTALLYALFFLSTTLTPDQQRRYHLIVTGDSLLLVSQMSGKWKIKEPTIKILAGIAKDLSKNMLCTYKHVLRAFNSKADELANQGVDTKRRPPEAFLKYLQEHGITLNLD